MESSQIHYYVPEGVLIVEGVDAATFMQGQFSQDLRISDGDIAYGLWLSHKGKIKADSFVLKVSAEQFMVFSYFGGTASLQENLDSRIIMDEVETRSGGPDWYGVSVWGDAIDVAMESIGLERPSENQFTSKDGVYAFWGRREMGSNLEILCGDASKSRMLEKAFSERGIRILDSIELDVLSVKNRRFQVGHDILNTDLPQETDLADCSVSYGKGCYIGQEVMARLKSIGRPRRSLEVVYVSEIPEGDGPWTLETNEGLRAGELRRVLPTEADFIGSAMLKQSKGGEKCFRIEGQNEIVVSRNSIRGSS